MPLSISFTNSISTSGFWAFIRLGEEINGKCFSILNEVDKNNIYQSIKLLKSDRSKSSTTLVSAHEWLAVVSLDEAFTDLSHLPEDQTLLKWDNAIGGLYHHVKKSGFSKLSIDLTGICAPMVARARYALALSAYRFDAYFSSSQSERSVDLNEVEIVCDDLVMAEAAFVQLNAVLSGVNLARDLVSEPANILNPETYAEKISKLNINGLSVEVLGRKEMTALGMNALLGVGQGSAKESKLVILKWNGDEGNSAPVAFVGKGVTFDTGGISIKPADGMEDMKWDMGGSAAVVGTMIALAMRKARVNAVGVVGLVENMPDGNAQRPGDVVKAMSGTTIEVINTDAEGRLVLADALWYTQERFKPQFMIDLATLTGAMIIALGTDYAGIFSNNDELTERLMISSKSVGENLWPMPMPKQYEKQIESKIADIRNIGGRAAGSITAALFLQRFVNQTPWVHLDIAPTAWTTEQRIPTNPEGGTGFGVRTLNELVSRFYESPKS